MWYYTCSLVVRGYLTMNSMVQIHNSVTLLTSRDHSCQHASQISVVTHISWAVTTWPTCRVLFGRCYQLSAEKQTVCVGSYSETDTTEMLSLRLPHAKSSHEITWHNTRVCHLTWREDSVSPALNRWCSVLRASLVRAGEDGVW